MRVLKLLWKNLSTRVCLLVSSIVMIFLITATLIVSLNGFISGTLNIVLGGMRPIVAKDDTGNIYECPYNSKNQVLAAANKFNEKIEEEGIILLKNEDNVLPLKKNSAVTVFGKNSVNLVYGGSGSGGGTGSDRKTLYDSLTDAGFSFNTTMKSFYENNAQSGNGRPKNPEMGDIIAGFETGETPVSLYPSNPNYQSAADAALVVISRIGGEGFDLPRTMKTSYAADAVAVNGARSADDHYLQLDTNETAMIKEACDNFNNVIIILNTSQPIELGFLDDPSHYAYNSKIKAALWIGMPGTTGIMALGRVLNGDVNPSGHTMDTFARDFKKDPTWNNFGNNNKESGNGYTRDGNGTGYYFVEYEEGLNVGYRYYETRGLTDGEEWYNSNIVYPFGYGKSYTQFEWNVKSETEEGAVLEKDGKLSFDVEVKNIGDFDGKDVVQLYYSAPYTAGGIEKSHVVLGDFAKTDLITKDGGSGKVTVEINVRDMASYDYNNANGDVDGHMGYELEGGVYTIYIAEDSHGWANENAVKFTFTVPDGGFRYDNDSVTNNPVKNLFDDVSNGLGKIFTRNGWVNEPTTPSDSDREVTTDFISSLTYHKDDQAKPWQTDKMPTQAPSIMAKDDISISLKDMAGAAFDDERWEQLLNQLTVQQMAQLVGQGAFGTVGIDNISKPLTYDSDGPSGFTNFMATMMAPVYDTCSYVVECVIGATWNTELARGFGEMIGNEGLIGNERDNTLPYSGWYAPAINIHRSPFSGRNWEYYSEDGYLSGKLAVEVCKGAKSKGVYTFVKHFALNDQETNRDSNGILVWADEQVMREIYFKPFEMVVKYGETTGIMSSFNRIGTTWAGGSYPLLTQLLREEWGFKGAVITDYALSRYMNVEQMIRAGGDVILNQEKLPSYKNADATQVTLLRNSTKNILYVVANSNAMGAEILGYRMPIWTEFLIIFDVVVFVGFVIWAFIVIRKVLKSNRVNEVSSSTQS